MARQCTFSAGSPATRGLLKQVEGRKPVEVSQRSVIDVECILQGVRDAFPTHQWTKALAAFLHDRDLQSQPSFVKGRQEYERGEFVEH